MPRGIASSEGGLRPVAGVPTQPIAACLRFARDVENSCASRLLRGGQQPHIFLRISLALRRQPWHPRFAAHSMS